MYTHANTVTHIHTDAYVYTYMHTYTYKHRYIHLHRYDVEAISLCRICNAVCAVSSTSRSKVVAVSNNKRLASTAATALESLPLAPRVSTARRPYDDDDTAATTQAIAAKAKRTGVISTGIGLFASQHLLLHFFLCTGSSGFMMRSCFGYPHSLCHSSSSSISPEACPLQQQHIQSIEYVRCHPLFVPVFVCYCLQHRRVV
jgi:hypothetical protein